MGRSKRQRAKAKAENAKAATVAHDSPKSFPVTTHDTSFRGRIADHADKQTAASPSRQAVHGSDMQAGDSPEFNMYTTTTATFGDASASITSVVPLMEACQQKELNMRTHEVRGHRHYDSDEPTPVQYTQRAETATAAVVTPEMMLAASQLLQEMKLTQIPPTWSDPTVEPLLIEVLNARAKSITRARSRREKRRQNRRK